MSKQVPVGVLHFIESSRYRAEKALVAAKACGIRLDTKVHDTPVSAKLRATHPTGKFPALDTDMGVIFSSNAIARYVARCRADSQLYGKSFDEESRIDTWLEFCTQEIEIPLLTWIYPILGLVEDKPDVTRDAKVDVNNALKVLETQLQKTEYLAGGYLTLADIVAVCTLREGFTRVFDPAYRKPHHKVCAWFEHCCGLPHFKDVLGEVNLCVVAEKPKAFTKELAPPAQKESKETAPKQPVVASVGQADLDMQIQALGDEIRVLKEKLKAEGLKGKELNNHESVKSLVGQLQSLKNQEKAAPAAAPVSVPSSTPVSAPPATAVNSNIDDQVKAVGDQLRELKEKLKGEGLTGKKLNEHESVKALVVQLQELKSQQKAGAAQGAAPRSEDVV